MNRTLSAIGAAASALLLTANGSALAADAASSYPDKPIHIIVPYPPGGSTDVLARMMGQRIGETLKQTVIVENRAGASGALGASYVAKSPPDGYTLFLGTSTALAVNPSLFTSLPYNVKEFTPIVLATMLPSVVAVPAKLPVKDMKDLMAYLKAHPGTNYASSGNGTPAHLGAELFKKMTGLNMTHIPYKGGAPALTDLAGGQTSLMFGILPETMPLVQNGQLRALAVTTAKRLPNYPDMPTVAESGVPGYELIGWYAFLAPAGTPPAIVAKLNKAFNEALHNPADSKRLTDMGFEVAGGAPDKLTVLMVAETAKWKKVIDDAHVKVD
jgi:tripartite-type tricarboxylate transporter receptor subunit TctC